jgi:nucleoside-diphosphate-sugar epimerase
VSTLIVGCGYLGARVGSMLVRRGDHVWGTVRSTRRATEIASHGINPVIADVLGPETLGSLPAAERVLYCVGYNRAGGADMRTVYVEGLQNLLERLPAFASRLVYASSTSVYGQSEGEWVDEDSPAEPLQDSGRVCLEAEHVARHWARAARASLVVLRLSGLYGPDRVIRRALLERGEPIPGDPARYLNLVHIDDAAQAAVAALDAAGPDPLYLVSDDRPVERCEYYALAAHLLNAPPPRYESEGSSPGKAAVGQDASNRRIANRRMRTGLGLELLYPDIAAGLPAALGWRGARRPETRK